MSSRAEHRGFPLSPGAQDFFPCFTGGRRRGRPLPPGLFSVQDLGGYSALLDLVGRKS